MEKLKLFMILVLSTLLIINAVDAQQTQEKKIRKLGNRPSDANYVKPAPPKVEEEVEEEDYANLPDRDVVFDLEKLSKLATLSVYGKPALAMNGVVIAEVTVDEKGKIDIVIIRRSEFPKLSKPAHDVIYTYAKKYKLKPAIRNGKPVKQEGIQIPVLFDMSLFDNNSSSDNNK